MSKHRRGTDKPPRKHAVEDGYALELPVDDLTAELAREYTAWQSFWRGISKHRRKRRR